MKYTHEQIVKITRALLAEYRRSYWQEQGATERVFYRRIAGNTGEGEQAVTDIAEWLGLFIDEEHDNDIDFDMDLDQFAREMLQA